MSSAVFAGKSLPSSVLFWTLISSFFKVAQITEEKASLETEKINDAKVGRQCVTP
jgi:hypothetical protein